MAKATDTAEAIGKRILEQLKAMLGGEWTGLTAADKQLLSNVANDAAYVTLAKLAGKDTKRDELQIHAALASLSDAGLERARRYFWQAANIVLSSAVAFAKLAI